MLREVTAEIRTIFNTLNRSTAEVYMAMTVQKYEKTALRLADWMKMNIPEGLTVFD